jgi:glycosyltransferase involved in cell wall biosynthesis
MEMPFVSVVMPTRNRADMLKRAIAALEAQDYPNFEIIVVDNGSTDETPQVIADAPRARALVNPIPGVSLSRQKGIEAAKGSIIAMCDDDTVPKPDWLRHLVEKLVSDDKIALVGGLTINHGFQGVRVNKGRGKIGRNGTITLLEDPTDSDYFASMNTAFRRDVFLMIGGYDPFYRTGGFEEPDLAMRMKAIGYTIAYVPEAVLDHYHTSVSHRRRFAFYNSDLMRLYFVMKHLRPRGLGAWLSFWSYEAKLMAAELWKVSKAFVIDLMRRDWGRMRGLGLRVYNAFSSRLAIVWIMRRVAERRGIESQASVPQNSLQPVPADSNA